MRLVFWYFLNTLNFTRTLNWKKEQISSLLCRLRNWKLAGNFRLFERSEFRKFPLSKFSISQEITKQGVFSFAYFALHEQRKVGRHRRNPKLNKIKEEIMEFTDLQIFIHLSDTKTSPNCHPNHIVSLYPFPSNSTIGRRVREDHFLSVIIAKSNLLNMARNFCQFAKTEWQNWQQFKQQLKDKSDEFCGEIKLLFCNRIL